MKRPLWVYVVGVIIALVIVNWFVWQTGSEAKLQASEQVSFGFLLGMLAMYIAVHFVQMEMIFAIIPYNQ